MKHLIFKKILCKCFGHRWSESIYAEETKIKNDDYSFKMRNCQKCLIIIRETICERCGETKKKVLTKSEVEMLKVGWVIVRKTNDHEKLLEKK